MITFLFEEGGNRRLTDGVSGSFYPFFPLHPTLKIATAVIFSKTPLKSAFFKNSYKLTEKPQNALKTPLNQKPTDKPLSCPSV